MIEDFALSKTYTLYDLTGSDSHPELVEENRSVASTSLAVRQKLVAAATLLLEPLTLQLGHKIVVTSGFRCNKLNNVTEGASVISQHMKGEAVDCAATGKEQLRLMQFLSRCQYAKSFSYLSFPPVDAALALSWHQFRVYPQRGFFHISLQTGVNDMQIDII
jgi:hypothetical protein